MFTFRYDPPGAILALLADGTVAGCATTSPFLHGLPMKAGQVFLQVDVRPEHRRQGIGTALCREALAVTSQQGATSVCTSVAAGDEAALAFARRFGFTFDYEMVESDLDLTQFDLSPWLGAVAAAENRGIRFTTLLQAQDEPDILQKLYILDEGLSWDVPQWSGVMPPFAEFSAALQAHDPEGIIIAAKGETIIGYCVTDSEGYTEFMGVLPEHRGQGAALALKVLTIAWAQRRGIPHLRTHNNAATAPILGLNRKLGYITRPGTIYLIRQ